jgi:hypothetical protein
LRAFMVFIEQKCDIGRENTCNWAALGIRASGSPDPRHYADVFREDMGKDIQAQK